MLFPYPKRSQVLARDVISIPVASKLILPEIRTRQCRVPTIYHGRETALPCPLYHSGAAGIDMTTVNCQLTTDTFPNKFEPPYPPDFAANNRQKVPQLP